MKFERTSPYSSRIGRIPTGKTPKYFGAKLFLTFLSLLVICPLGYLIVISFQNTEEYFKMLWPRALRFDNYLNIIADPFFWRWALNSGVITLMVVVLVLVVGAMAGYVVAKFSSRLVRLFAILILGALMVPIHMVLMPVFVLSRQLGLLNSPWSVIGPSVAFGIPLAMYIFRGFFVNVPGSLSEAARIDGASELLVFIQVMLPMTKPAIATVGVFTFLGSWNGFLFPLILLQNTENYTLPVGLATIGTQYFTNYPVQAAAMLMVSMPLILLYVKFNKQVIQGMLEGAVKG
jgi:raffinose/stachyose/melibiose transport system permease protein